MMQRSTGTSIIGNSLPIWKFKTYLRKLALTDSLFLIRQERQAGVLGQSGGSLSTQATIEEIVKEQWKCLSFLRFAF